MYCFALIQSGCKARSSLLKAPMCAVFCNVALCPEVVPGAKAHVKSENGLLLLSTAYPWSVRKGKWRLPTAHSLAADSRMFFLACPTHATLCTSAS